MIVYVFNLLKKTFRHLNKHVTVKTFIIDLILLTKKAHPSPVLSFIYMRKTHKH